MPDRPERPIKRPRRLSTDYDDSSGTDDWIPGARKDRDREPRKEREKEKERAKERGPERYPSAMPRASSSRRRANQNPAATGSPLPSITVARPPVATDDKKSIRLTVKMPSQKLREATSGSTKSISVNSRDRLEVREIVTGPRGSRSKKPIVEASESEEDDDDDDDDEEEEEEEEDEEDEEDDEEEEEEEEEEEADEDEDGDAEGESEDVDADGDIDMDDPPMQPASFVKVATPVTKPIVKVTPAAASLNAKSAQAKETEDDDDDGDDDDDDELSELESEEDDDATGIEVDEDIEVEDDGGEEEDEDEDDEDSDSGTTPATGSRASTPDLSRLTQRQRSRLDQVLSGELLELPAGIERATAKKALTADEQAMRRAEMARRRKNLSEKRNEEEKMDTINKLLKKQAPKRRGRAGNPTTDTTNNNSGGDATPANGEVNEVIVHEKPNRVFVRWVSNAQGSRLGVPEEWLGEGVGRVFGGGGGSNGVRRMVEEVN